MRRMYSLNQLEEIARKQAKEVKKDVATLVDKDGNDRFQDFNLSMETITGATFTYAKASLSGSHLLIVIAGVLESGNALSQVKWGDLPLPKWIRDKIFPTYASYLGAFAGQIITAGSYQVNEIIMNVDKTNDGLRIDCGSSISSSESNRYFRIPIDLLIDFE